MYALDDTRCVFVAHCAIPEHMISYLIHGRRFDDDTMLPLAGFLEHERQPNPKNSRDHDLTKGGVKEAVENLSHMISCA